MRPRAGLRDARRHHRPGVIPTALYTMHADGIAALLTYIFKTP
jgi:hypothetical protein